MSFDSTAPFVSRRPFLLMGWLSVLCLSGGCTLLIGAEKRVEEEPGATGPIDEETQISTNDLCIEYCDEVMDHCTGGNAVYASRSSCINTCNALPPGEAAEPSGNTVQCRLRRARGAASAPDEECVAAGPGGDPSCGSNCEAWCELLEHECPDDAEVLADCEATCEGIADRGGFDVDGSYERDDIQCRLIHLGAVGGDPESPHCGHARYIASEKCIPESDAQPTCQDYCATTMANCRGSHAVYDSEDDCIAACGALPLGRLEDRVENTIGCRSYHGRSSSQDPGTHCDHASATGDGHCGNAEGDENTGNCESYCRLFGAGCSDEFDAAFSGLSPCVEACENTFDDRGAANDTFYSLRTARDGDSLQCRVYFAVKALAGDDEACEKASPSGTCD